MDQSMKPEIARSPILSKNWRTCGVWQAILLGLAPLAYLAVIGATVLLLIMLIHFLIDPVTFFLVQQWSFAVVMVAGLALAIFMYIQTIKHAFRQIETWRQDGQTTKVLAGQVTLTLVAIIITLPVLLTLFFH